MPDWVIFLIGFICGLVPLTVGVFVGAWIMFKGRSPAQAGEQFIGTPKGDVFRLETPDDAPFPDDISNAENHILNRAKQFFKGIDE